MNFFHFFLLWLVLIIVGIVLHRRKTITIFSDYTDSALTIANFALVIIVLIIFGESEPAVKFIVGSIGFLSLFFFVARQTVLNNPNPFAAALALIIKYSVCGVYAVFLVGVFLSGPKTRREGESQLAYELRYRREKEDQEWWLAVGTILFLGFVFLTTRMQEWASLEDYFLPKGKSPESGPTPPPIVPAVVSIPPAPSQRYLCNVTGTMYGPYLLSEIQAMVASGQLKSDLTNVWAEGMASWIPLQTFLQQSPMANSFSPQQPTSPELKTQKSFSAAWAIALCGFVLLGLSITVLIVRNASTTDAPAASSNSTLPEKSSGVPSPEESSGARTNNNAPSMPLPATLPAELGAPQGTVSAEPLPEAMTENASPDSNAMASFVDHFLSLTGPANTMNFISLFAPRVRFFDRGLVSREDIAKERSRYTSYWPSVSYQRCSQVTCSPGPDQQQTIEFDYQYVVESPTRNERISGLAHCVLTIQLAEGDWKITSQNEKILSRKKETLS